MRGLLLLVFVPEQGARQLAHLRVDARVDGPEG